MSTATTASNTETQDPWLPMIVIAMGQALMSFNVAALPVSMGGMVESFGVPPTTVGTAIVMYSLGVSGFIMLGAKLGQRFGSRLFFQSAVALFLLAMITMVTSPTASVMLVAQAMAGLAGAALVPSLVVLIANHFRGAQQAKALGWLGSARAMAGVLAFLIIGTLERWVGWRVAFGLLIVHAAAILLLSFKLKPSTGRPEIKIDLFGVLLAASAIISMTFGFNNIRNWGLFLAGPRAPFEIFGVSPAPMMIVVGVVLAGAFLAWTANRTENKKTPLIALEVVRSAKERATLLAMFIIVSLEAATNFTVPLYIQIVQGRDAFQTAIAMMPFNLSVFFTAILVVKLYDRLSPRQIASYAFTLVAAGALWLAWVVRNDWSTFPVLLGLVAFGIGQGALVTVLFNVLVTSSPKELSADVGALRGTAGNLAASVGTAVMGALVVGVLSVGVMRAVTANPVITTELKDQVNLDSINFLSNDRLAARLKATTATPEQITAAMSINEEARLRALKIAFFALAGIALMAIFPCRFLPDYRPEQVPSDAEAKKT
jgi:predicted MFS family arabinose efflux permease